MQNFKSEEYITSAKNSLLPIDDNEEKKLDIKLNLGPILKKSKDRTDELGNSAKLKNKLSGTLFQEQANKM